MSLIFDEATHTYLLDGRKLPSVTEVINDLLPPFHVHKWYLQRGTAVHKCAALIAQGKQFKNDNRIAGQVAAIKKFFEEVKPEVILVEMPIYSEKYGFAGIPDLICRIDSRICIVDYKGTIDLERAAIQLAAYKIAGEEKRSFIGNAFGIGIQINENSTYSMTKRIDLTKYRHQFLSLLNAWKIRERMGYHKTRESGK